MSYENVLFEKEDGIALLTLNRPDVMNSLNVPLMVEILSVLKEVGEDPEVRVLVITGAGKGFCAGADLADAGEGNENPDAIKLSVGEIVSEKMKAYFNPIVSKVARLEKPVIAAVNGVTAGGGVGLAMATDIVIAGKSASFIQVFGPKLGIVPDMGSTWFLPRLLGSARSKGLAFLGEKLPAEKAAEWGLIWKCVDDDDLLSEVMEIARKFAKGPTKAYGYIKRAFMESGRNSLEEQLEFERYCQLILCDSKDFLEGVNAFLEKRKPNFIGL